MRRGSLSAGDRDAPAPPRSSPSSLAPLDDGAQAAHRAGVLALHPASARRGSQQPVGERRGDGLDVKLHARRAAGRGRELVDAERADAVVLAGAADLDDPVRALDLDERRRRPS